MNTCATCPDTARYATSLDKAVGTFKNRVLTITVHRSDTGFSMNNLSNPHFSFPGIAGQLAHVGHTGGGWLVIHGDHALGSPVMDVAIWQVTDTGAFTPLKSTDPRIGTTPSLRFGTDFTIIDAWPV